MSLAGSGLTDAGIKNLANLTNLESLDLRRTKVTAAGINELKAALPKCRIEWDGGVIEPSGTASWQGWPADAPAPAIAPPCIPQHTKSASLNSGDLLMTRTT